MIFQISYRCVLRPQVCVSYRFTLRSLDWRFKFNSQSITFIIYFAIAFTTGTATEFPNCLYACVSETGIIIGRQLL